MQHSNRNYDMNEEIITKIQSFFSVYIVSIIQCNGFPQMSQANDRLKKYYSKKCWQLFSAEQHVLAQSQLVLTVT